MNEKIMNRARRMAGGAALIKISDRGCRAQRSITGRNRRRVSRRGIGCPSNDGAEDLCVTGARLALAAAPELAAPGDNNHGHYDGEHGREAG